MKRSVKYLMTLLGFGAAASCSFISREEYGCPYVEYKVSGRVVDENGEPVKGIGVYPTRESNAAYWDPQYAGDQADTTGVDGRFEISSIAHRQPEKLIVIDTDGLENGKYSDTEVAITPKQVKIGDGKWYDGSYEATDIEVVVN